MGYYKIVLRRLYGDTIGQPSFSSNDLRKYNLQDIVGNVGGFFRWIQDSGYAVRIGEERAQHGEAHGRRIGTWVWTEKTRAIFGG